MKRERCPCLRSQLIEFLIQSAQLLEVSPIVKYSALSLFADRFYPDLSRFEDDRGNKNWLLHPIRESNLQLFALVSIWVSSKIHDTPALSIKNFKSLGDKFIKEQHYTERDLLEAVLKFGIGTLHSAFVLVEELLSQLKVVSRVGEHVNFDACMDILDLLYEKEVTSILYSSPRSLAASILERVDISSAVVAAYVITVPVQRWEFPVLPWVKFITLCKEEEILCSVKAILKHILEPHAD